MTSEETGLQARVVVEELQRRARSFSSVDTTSAPDAGVTAPCGIQAGLLASLTVDVTLACYRPSLALLEPSGQAALLEKQVHEASLED